MQCLHIINVVTIILNVTSICMSNSKVLRIWNLDTNQKVTYAKICLWFSCMFSTRCKSYKNNHISKNMTSSVIKYLKNIWKSFYFPKKYSMIFLSKNKNKRFSFIYFFYYLQKMIFRKKTKKTIWFTLIYN